MENFSFKVESRVLPLECAAESGDDEEHEEDDEKDLCDAGCRTSEATEAEDTGNQREDEKSECPVEHGWVGLFVGMVAGTLPTKLHDST